MLRRIALLSSLLLIPTISYAQVTIVPSRSISTGGGGGNVTGPGSSIDSNLACWNGTTGLSLKDCGYSNTAFLSSSATSTQSGSFASLLIKNNISPAFYLTILDNETITAGRTLNIVTGDATRTLTFTANATIGGTNSGDATLSGAQGFLTLAGQVFTMHNIVGTDISSSASINLSQLQPISNNLIVSNVSGLSASPSGNTLTIIIDDTICATQGSVLTRQAGAWVCLTPGTSGQYLQTQGSGANTQWANGATGVTRSGSTTDGHAAVFNGNNADSIKDGGVLPSFTPTPGVDQLIYYQGSNDNLFHPVTLTGLTLSGGVLSASVTSSSTTTFTNKTFNAEATGNSLQIPVIYAFLGGNCQGATGSTPFSIKSSGVVGTCITGTNENYGVADFSATGQEIQFEAPLPYDLANTTLDLYIQFRTPSDTNVGHNAVFVLYTSCVGDGQAGDPSWTTSATITRAIKGTATFYNNASALAVTMQSSPTCSAGNTLKGKLVLDAATTATGHEYLHWAYLVPRRLIQ